ncbi:MAG: GNAT family N-acetyltransferase [Candidatus Nanopelagicales bacterium]
MGDDTAATGGVRVRAFADGDWPLFRRLDELAFGYTAEAELVDVDSPVMDHGRSLIAEVDAEPAGLASAYPFPLSVPGGGSVPAAGTTWVGVLPTHRRRGVLRAMMTRHLVDSRERGDAVAVLWASEPSIYGRFGFGVGSRDLALALSATDVDPALPGAPYDPSLRARIVAPEDARAAMAAVYRAQAAQRPGAPARDDAWWDRVLVDPVSRRDGASERRCLLVEDATSVRGYALYATRFSFDDTGSPDGTLNVRELLSVDPAARAALWRVLLGHDLMTRTTWRSAPSDEPLLEWAPIRRGLHGPGDQLYVRVLDIAAALTGRAYASPVDAVLEVRDGMVDTCAGRWRLTVGPDGRAACVRTADDPDVSLDVRDLGGVYLGARSLWSLALAGVAQAHDPGQVRALSAALRHEPAAWCPHVF